MIADKALNIADELTSLRRRLHKTPELAFEEFETSKIIQETLKKYNIPFKVVAKTGVVALIEGGFDGKTILLRADIDGLPITETADVDYKSEIDGHMHACGHDVHTACLLGAAKLLNEIKDSLHGNVKLVFQPAEEGVGGALPMINEGVMENPHVDSAFAMHVEPLEEVGNIQVRDGAIMASPDDFELTVYGVGGHGAYPHKCVDPILVASMIVNAYQTIISRHFDPMIPAVVSVCSFHAGSCTNAIPDTATLTGTARSLDKESRAKLAHLLEKIAVDTAKSMGAKCDFKFKPLYPPTINDKGMNKIVVDAANKLNIVKEVVTLETASMAGEDFAYFVDLVPGAYFKLGVGNKEKGISYPIHNPSFAVDERSLTVGCAMMAQIAIDYLNEN